MLFFELDTIDPKGKRKNIVDSLSPKNIKKKDNGDLFIIFDGESEQTLESIESLPSENTIILKTLDVIDENKEEFSDEYDYIKIDVWNFNSKKGSLNAIKYQYLTK